ncbi:MAG: hypothetical protein ACO39V_01840 [Arenicellales bacterium]
MPYALAMGYRSTVKIERRWQQMKALFLSAVVLLIDGFLALRKREDLGFAVATENGLFVRVQMMVTGRQSIQGPVLRCRSAEITKISTVIHIQTRHLVETHNRIEALRRCGFLHLIEEPPVTHVVAADTTGWQNIKTYPVGFVSLPL